MPDSTSYGINRTLSGFAIRYTNDVYISELVSPVREVDSKSAFFYSTGETDELDEYETEVGDEGAVGESKGERNQESFTTRAYSHQAFLGAEAEEEGAGLGFDEETSETNRVTDVVLRKEERFVAATLSNATNYPGMTSSPVVKWGTATVKQMLTDINTGVDALVPEASSKLQLVLGLPAWRSISMNAALIANVTPSKAVAQLKEDVVAELLGVDEIVVGKAKYTTKIKQRSTRANIWGDVAILHYVNPNPTLVSTGHVVTFRRKLGGLGTRVYKIRSERGGDGGTLIKVTKTQDAAHIINDQAGYLFTAVSA